MTSPTSNGQDRLVERDIVRLKVGAQTSGADVVTVEEPLEIRVQEEAVAVVMRTPKDDFDLVAGFLYTEGVVAHPRDVGTISYCESAEPPNVENVVDVRLSDGVEFDRERLKRNFYASSSCGVCGKASIDHIRAQAPKITADFTVSIDVLYELSDKLRQSQDVFDKTGSLHAAGLFDVNGKLLALREDVGRHNAVDKLVGSFILRDQLPPPTSILMVSGRSSFEIMQKALMAGIPMVAAVSAPSSLAVDIARESNMTLVGFLRGRACNIYAGEGRIRL